MSQSIIHNEYFTYAEHKPAFFIVTNDEEETLTFWIVFGNNMEEVHDDMTSQGITVVLIKPMIEMFNTALKKIDLHQIKKDIIDR